MPSMSYNQKSNKNQMFNWTSNQKPNQNRISSVAVIKNRMKIKCLAGSVIKMKSNQVGNEKPN
jgi:hypothetical protein